ncbi:hypothetical protein SO802_008083 [Lithocarpus litseifolius]|uniref:NB-ARC domain-containing protein n=1 Tax=Lithocarpus litseifolius TaxID=425828 RepID=A0AAW2D8A1_9ROSI
MHGFVLILCAFPVALALSYFCGHGLALFHHVSLVEFGVYLYPLVQGHCGLSEFALFLCFVALTLVGCEDAERELVSRLLDCTEENLSVISLVSEEAVGKTTLARHVYKRLDIRQHFQCRLWVHVREEFAYKDLLLIIFKQIPICLLKDIELMSEKNVNWFSRL